MVFLDLGPFGLTSLSEKLLARGKRATDVTLLLAFPLRWKVGLTSVVSVNLTRNSFPPIPHEYLGGGKLQFGI